MLTVITNLCGDGEVYVTAVPGVLTDEQQLEFARKVFEKSGMLKEASFGYTEVVGFRVVDPATNFLNATMWDCSSSGHYDSYELGYGNQEQ